jgi:hypothetical protein
MTIASLTSRLHEGRRVAHHKYRLQRNYELYTVQSGGRVHMPHYHQGEYHCTRYGDGSGIVVAGSRNIAKRKTKIQIIENLSSD